MALFIVAGIEDVMAEEALATLALIAGNRSDLIESNTRLFSLEGLEELFDDNILADTDPGTIEFWEISVPTAEFPNHTDQPDTAGPSLIKFLVENGENYIVGYPSSYKVRGMPIEGGGFTIPIEAPAPQEASGTEFSRIWMIFDGENCGGSGSHVFTAGGAKIASTVDEIVYHEMAHALRLIDFEQDILIGTNTPDEEEQAVVERTNEYRAFKGGSPRVSDPENSHFHKSACGQADALSGTFCFVVTASYGHPAHQEVVRVQRLREELIGRSRIAAGCYTAIKSEYDKFSPTLADAMRADERLRALVRTHLVEPLLLFADLAKLFVERGDEFVTLSDVVDCAIAECGGRKNLDLDVFDPVVGREVCRALEDLRYRLASRHSHGTWRDGRFCGDPRDISQVISGIGDLLADRGVDVSIIDWAIVSPLSLAWSGFQAVGAGSDVNAVGRGLVADARSWFKATPWEELGGGALSDCIEDDLLHIAGFARSRAVRREVAAALRDAFPSLCDRLEAIFETSDTLTGNGSDASSSLWNAMR